MKNPAKDILLWSFVVGLGGFLVLGSCTKDLVEVQPNPNVQEFSDIRTSSTFNWNTTQDVTLLVTGMATPNKVSKTLKVMSVDSTVVFFSKLQPITDNLVVTFPLPTTVTRVKVVYGVISKDTTIVNKIIRFNYITVDLE